MLLDGLKVNFNYSCVVTGISGATHRSGVLTNNVLFTTNHGGNTFLYARERTRIIIIVRSPHHNVKGYKINMLCCSNDIGKGLSILRVVRVQSVSVFCSYCSILPHVHTVQFDHEKQMHGLPQSTSARALAKGSNAQCQCLMASQT